MPHKIKAHMTLPRPEDERSVMHAWERFLVDGVCPSTAIRDAVLHSWRRCSQLGVAPDRNRAPLLYTEDSLQQLVSNLPELAEAARTVCVRARDFLAESGTIMVVTDPEGVIIHAEGNPNTIDAAGDISLIPGGQWQEAVAGTNAIGTALEAQGPVQIHGAEHFCEGIKKWTCSATVIEDPFDRRILGVVDISGLQSTYDPHCLALAVSTASAIQEQILKRAMEKRANLLDKVLGRFTSGPCEGLILFDDRGRLVNANANAAHALARQGVLPAESHAEIARFRGNRLYDRAGRELSMVSPEWVTPVVEGSWQLGTVLIVPSGERSAGHRRGASTGAGGSCWDFDSIRRLCPSLGRTVDKAQPLARHNVSVLIRGETGVGKEVMAHAIHNGGTTSDGPFIALNCSALPKDLLASELFGYGPGAFTGARKGGMTGKIEAADGGTLFLDEIGEMPLEIQPQFLRVLQEGELYRLGENTPRQSRFRLLTATNRDLREMVSRGLFRLDLYYRLAVVTLDVPPLRERVGDIVVMARQFIEDVAEEYELTPKSISVELERRLKSLAWPGNVRELRNAIEAMMLMSEGDVLTVADLPDEYGVRHEDVAVDAPPQPDVVRLKDAEHEAIVRAIRDASGNVRQAAKILGIGKSTLYEKVKRLGIDPKAL